MQQIFLSCKGNAVHQVSKGDGVVSPRISFTYVAGDDGGTAGKVRLQCEVAGLTETGVQVEAVKLDARRHSDANQPLDDRYQLLRCQKPGCHRIPGAVHGCILEKCLAQAAM